MCLGVCVCVCECECVWVCVNVCVVCIMDARCRMTDIMTVCSPVVEVCHRISGSYGTVLKKSCQ